MLVAKAAAKAAANSIKPSQKTIGKIKTQMKQGVKGVKDNIKSNVKAAINGGLSQTMIQQIVAKALIDAGMMLQKTSVTKKKVPQKTEETTQTDDNTNDDNKNDDNTNNENAAFGRRKIRKHISKTTKSAPLSHFGWKGSLSTNQRQNALQKAAKSLGVKKTIEKLLIVQRLHRKNKTGQVCAKDIKYLKSSYKK